MDVIELKQRCDEGLRTTLARHSPPLSQPPAVACGVVPFRLRRCDPKEGDVFLAIWVTLSGEDISGTSIRDCCSGVIAALLGCLSDDSLRGLEVNVCRGDGPDSPAKVVRLSFFTDDLRSSASSDGLVGDPFKIPNALVAWYEPLAPDRDDSSSAPPE